MRKLVNIICVLCFCTNLLAAPARPGTIKLRQPDGTIVLAIQKGDEFYHVLTDLEGHALVKDDNGYFCYARYEADGTEVSTGWVAGVKAPSAVLSGSMSIPHDILQMKAAEKRTLAEEQRSLTAIQGRKTAPKATSGDVVKKKCIVILANFADTTMRYTQSQFEDLFNKPGYSFQGAKGSVMEYFKDQLENYEFTFVVSPIVTLPNSQKYYGEDGDALSYQAVVDACKLANEYVDFSQFDGNGDKEVDNIFFIHAGTDEAESGNTDAIWAHQYYLKYTKSRNVVLDGVRLNTYTICSELARRNDGRFRMATIGTFCHEYGHTLGLADMYDVDGTGSGGKSEALNYYTGVMDCGCYNNDGVTPAHYNAIDYDTLGYGDCEELAVGTYEIEPISQSLKYYKVPSNVDGEYYLIECRNNKDWDAYIQGKGLAIYHIDRSNNPAGMGSNGREMSAKNRWINNAVNDNPSHQCADMIEPDYKSPSAKKAFFPWNNVNSFTPITQPGFLFWDGSASSLSITDIKIESNGNVTFNVAKSGDIIKPTVIDFKETVYQTTASISFACSVESSISYAVVTWGIKGGEQKEEKLEQGTDGRFSLSLDNLSPGTEYSFKIQILFPGGIESECLEKVLATYPADGHGEPYIFMGEVKQNADGSFDSGTKLPFVVFNTTGVDDIRWYLNGTAVYPGKDGYYTITKSGILKAVLRYSNGDTETISRRITIK